MTVDVDAGRGERALWQTPALEAAGRQRSDALLARYAELPAPAPGELQGEYAAALPADRDGPVRDFFVRNGRGDWLAKAYRVDGTDGTRGEGLNVWVRGGRTVRCERFRWELAPSQLDGQPALVMHYDAFRHVSAALGLVDEIRRLDDRLYLGIYRTRIAVPPFTRTQAGAASAPEVFLLSGPCGPWVGPDEPRAEQRWAPHHAALRVCTTPRAGRPVLGGLLRRALGERRA